MIGTQRVRTYFTSEDKPKHPFIGDWNPQYEDSSGGAWSFANAHRVIDIQPDFELLSTLLNTANGHNALGTKDISNLTIHEHVVFTEDSSIILEKPEKPFCPHHIYDLHECNIENAQEIKSILDEGNAILTRVNVDNYSLNPHHTFPHPVRAIVLSGYYIGHQREMNIQLIDPRLGVMWTSLEHFTYSNRPNDTYILKPNPER